MVLWIPARIFAFSPTGFLPSAIDLSRSIRLKLQYYSPVLNPVLENRIQNPVSRLSPAFEAFALLRRPAYFLFSGLCALFSRMVWASSLSLAATQKIDVSFSSSGYLDVSVPPVFLHNTMCSCYDTRSLLLVGFPIRTSAGQGLFAAHRSLSQLITSFFGSWCQGIHHMLFLA